MNRQRTVDEYKAPPHWQEFHARRGCADGRALRRWDAQLRKRASGGRYGRGWTPGENARSAKATTETVGPDNSGGNAAGPVESDEQQKQSGTQPLPQGSWPAVGAVADKLAPARTLDGL